MRIYSDTLKQSDLHGAMPGGNIFLSSTARSARKRAHRFDVHIVAHEGYDAHGILRAYSTNTGTSGADDFTRAATWIEWGDWMVKLFKVDPNAIIGQYNGLDDFIYQTTEYAPHRPERENAPAHAERWANELYDNTILAAV